MSPEQARAARAILKIGVRDVAEATGVTPNTVSRIESPPVDGKRGPQASTIMALATWYQSQGIVFLDEGDEATGAGVCFEAPRAP